MSRVYSRAQQRLGDLIMRAEGFRADTTPEPRAEASIPSEDLWQFLVSALQTVRSVCGEDSPHYHELQLRRTLFTDEPLRLHGCIGILAAAADDLDSGMLSDVRELVAA